VASFLRFDSIFNCFSLLTYYQKKVLSTIKCAFFYELQNVMSVDGH
jgi:hypothetical protein